MASGAGHSTRRTLTRIGMEPMSPVRAVAGKERVPHLRRSGINLRREPSAYALG